MSEFKVYRMNDSDFMVARTKEEAIATYERDYCEVGDHNDVEELTAEQMQTFEIHGYVEDGLSPEDAPLFPRTFAKQLEEMATTEPGLFATRDF